MFTDKALKALRPREKAYKRSDQKGLYVIVRPDGSIWWRFKYQWAGREKGLSVGVYPDVSLALAREKRDQMRGQLARGVDPATQRKAERLADANTFEALAREWLAAGGPGGRGRGMSSKTIDQLEHRLKTYVFPYLGRWPIGDITPPELLKVLRRIEAKGTLETAHRVRAVASRVFRYAITTGRAERDPAGDLTGAIAPAPRKHFAAVTDPRRFGVLLRALDRYPGQPVTRCALQLLALTFVRPGELRLATWREFDIRGRLRAP